MANVISFQREPEFYYNLALKAIKCSDYATAIRELLTAIKLDEKPAYLRELAECYYAIGAYKESIDIFYKLYEFSYSKECFNKIMRSYYRIENVLFDDLDIENMELEDLAEILDVPVKSNGNSTIFWAKTNSIDETIQKLGDYFHNEKTRKATVYHPCQKARLHDFQNTFLHICNGVHVRDVLVWCNRCRTTHTNIL